MAADTKRSASATLRLGNVRSEIQRQAKRLEQADHQQSDEVVDGAIKISRDLRTIAVFCKRSIAEWAAVSLYTSCKEADPQFSADLIVDAAGCSSATQIRSLQKAITARLRYSLSSSPIDILGDQAALLRADPAVKDAAAGILRRAEEKDVSFSNPRKPAGMSVAAIQMAGALMGKEFGYGFVAKVSGSSITTIKRYKSMLAPYVAREVSTA